jgi:hypothetical protein
MIDDPLHAAGLWTGLLILLMVVLSLTTVMRRRRLKVSLGDGGHGELAAASRAFGNASEYIPVGLVALVLMAVIGFRVEWIHAVGATLFLGRVLHAQGLLSGRAVTPGRLIGMLLTLSALIGAAVALIACPWL